MTISQPEAPARGRSLAGAVAVYLGGYLLLASLASSQLTGVAMNMFGALAGRGLMSIPFSFGLLLVLQFAFAIVVVVAGLLLARGPLAGRLLGSAIVVVGSVVLLLFFGARLSGAVDLPGGRAGIPFQAVLANPWSGVVLVVGIAWLLSRRARLGWLSLLGVLVLIPIPTALAFGGVDSGLTQITMFALSAVVGGGIIAAGRPLRD